MDVLQAVFISRSICMLLSTYTFGSQPDSPPWLYNLCPQWLETSETKEAYFLPFLDRNNSLKCCLDRIKWIICITPRICSHQQSVIVVSKSFSSNLHIRTCSQQSLGTRTLPSGSNLCNLCTILITLGVTTTRKIKMLMWGILRSRNLLD